MIHLRLAGGLGNQLYQLAAAALLHRAVRQPVSLVQDSLCNYPSKRDPDSLRVVQANWIRIPSETTSLSQIVISRTRLGRWLPAIGVSDRNFWQRLSRPRGGRYVMDGYFQTGWSQSVFLDALEQLTLKQSTPGIAIASDECAVHVRGGDFLKFADHNILTAAWYAKALARAKAEGFHRFVVVTDDPSHAAHIVEDAAAAVDYRIVQPSSDPLNDFGALAQASARIIGNSTFAWWAAATDPRRGITFSPSLFTRHRPRDLVLEWERLVPV